MGNGSRDLKASSRLGKRADTTRSYVLPEYAKLLYGPRWRFWRLVVALGFVGLCVIEGAAFSFLAPDFMAIFAAPAVVLALLSIWALPELTAVPTRTVEILFWIYVCTLVLWPNYLAIALPGLPWITLVRLSSFPMAVAFLVCVAGSKAFRTELSISIRSIPLIAALLIAFVVIQTISIVLSSDRGHSFEKYIEFQVTWTAMFFVSAYLFRRPKFVERWAALLWGTGVIVSAIGLWEYKLQHVPWAGHIPGFLKINDPNVARVLAGVFRYTGQYRIESTFSTSLGFGEFISLALPFVLHFVVTPRPWLVRLAAALSAILLTWLAILSGTRLAAVGCFLTLLLYVLVVSVRRWKRRPDSVLGPAVAFGYPMILVAALASTIFIGRVHRVIFGYGAQDRVDQYRMGLPIVIREPLGHGVAMGAATLGYGVGDRISIDTYYLSIALEYGVIGFLVYYSMFAVAIYESGKRALAGVRADHDQAFLAPAAMALINFVVIKSVFSQQDNHPLVYMILGLIVALVSRAQPTSAAESASRHMPDGLGRRDANLTT